MDRCQTFFSLAISPLLSSISSPPSLSYLLFSFVLLFFFSFPLLLILPFPVLGRVSPRENFEIWSCIFSVPKICNAKFASVTNGSRYRTCVAVEFPVFTCVDVCITTRHNRQHICNGLNRTELYYQLQAYAYRFQNEQGTETKDFGSSTRSSDRSASAQAV